MGFKVSGLGCRVWGLEFRVLGFSGLGLVAASPGRRFDSAPIRAARRARPTLEWQFCEAGVWGVAFFA